jgi:flagellar biosynthesis/type III secretory pathway protein FliH
MSSQTKKTKKISIKYNEVIKSDSLTHKNPITISPIKDFTPPPVSTTEVSNDSYLEDSIENASPEEPAQEIDPSPAEDRLDIIQEESQKPDINSLDVMKRNINDEMKDYKDQQIASIQDELAQIKADVSKKAFQEAEAEGKKVYEKKTQELIEKSNELLTSINQLSSNKKENLFEKRDLVIKLAIEMAEKIVKKQIELDPASFESLFNEAFEKITDKDHVCIEVNPKDVAAVTAYQEKFESKFKDIEKLEIKETSEIARGGCTIETSLGYIDATLSSKLELLYIGFQAFHSQFDDDNRQAAKSTPPTKAAVDPEVSAEPNTPVEEVAITETEDPVIEDTSDESNTEKASAEENSNDDLSFNDDFDFDDLDDDFDFDDDLE